MNLTNKDELNELWWMSMNDFNITDELNWFFFFVILLNVYLFTRQMHKWTEPTECGFVHRFMNAISCDLKIN